GVAIMHSQFSALSGSRGQFGYFAYIWKRWYRLSVAMFGALLLLFLLPLTGDGPFWYITKNWMWPACTSSSSLFSSFLYYSNWNPSFNNYTIEDKFSVVSKNTAFY